MPDTARYVIVGLIILLTHFQEGITGFGCTVLALPFVTLLIGLDQAVPVLVVQAWVLAGLIVVVSRRHIAWREYRTIVGLAAVGLPVGMWVAHALPEQALRWVLAGFMLAVGLQGLMREARCPAMPAEAVACGSSWAKALLPLGGVIQGAFGSGGPLIVVYAARALTHKTVFRATLCMLWLTLNTVLIGGFVAVGRLNPPLLWLNAAYLPATLLGLWLGNHAHYRINERVFRRLVYGVLMGSGAVLVWSLLSSS
jgi:hypothetical protein